MRVFALTESKTMPHDIFASEPVQSYKWLRKNGFTLIELLVVIAIMAILLALLQTTLRKTLVKALEIQCAGKQKQVGVAFFAFTEDHDGSMPRHSNTHITWNAPFSGTWRDQLRVYTGANDSIFRCPSEDFDLIRSLYPTSTSTPTQSYGYNIHISCLGPSNRLSRAWRPYESTGWSKLSEIKSPSDLAVVADHASGGLFEKEYPVLLAQRYGYIGTDSQSSVCPWHDGISNYVHADGHVKGYSAYEDWRNDAVFKEHYIKHVLPSQDWNLAPTSPPSPP